MSKKVYKTTFNLTEDDFQWLKKTAQEKKVTLSDIIRQALGDYAFIEQQRALGAQVLVEDCHGNLQKVIYPH